MAERKFVYLAQCYLVTCSSGLPWASWQHQERVLRLIAKCEGTNLGSSLILILKVLRAMKPFPSNTHCNS